MEVNMNITDTFLGWMRLNDDDDDYEDDYEEEYEAPKSKNKAKKFIETEQDDEPAKETIRSSVKSKVGRSKVVPMRSKNGMEVCVIKPATIEDGREITNTLVSGRAVVLNLEGIHVELAQRIIDFTAGSCFAIDGNLQKVSNYIFIA